MTVEACAVVATSLKLNNKKEKGESCCLSDTGQQFHYVSQFEEQANEASELELVIMNNTSCFLILLHELVCCAVMLVMLIL